MDIGQMVDDLFIYQGLAPMNGWSTSSRRPESIKQLQQGIAQCGTERCESSTSLDCGERGTYGINTDYITGVAPLAQ